MILRYLSQSSVLKVAVKIGVIRSKSRYQYT